MQNPIYRVCYCLVRLLRRGYETVYVEKLRKSLGNIGPNSLLTSKVSISCPQNVFIGNNSYINGGQIIAGNKSRITIGNDCLISYNVHIRCTSHVIDNPDELIRTQGEWEADITIGNNVWIGFGAQILPGVTVGDNSVIGAGAVVTKNVDADTIVGGVPAKLIRRRKTSLWQ